MDIHEQLLIDPFKDLICAKSRPTPGAHLLAKRFQRQVKKGWFGKRLLGGWHTICTRTRQRWIGAVISWVRANSKQACKARPSIPHSSPRTLAAFIDWCNH